MPEYVEKYKLVDEASVLMRYAAANGIDPDGELLKPLDNALNAYNQAEDDEKAQHHGELISRYSALVERTAPVSGRTLLETRASQPTFFWLMVITFGVLLFAILNEGLAVWFAELPEPEEGLSRFVFQFRNSFMEMLSPFLWGGLGACVYLMKRLNDIAGDQQFDSARLKGWTLRLLLGAILGAVVAHIYDVSQLEGDAQNLGEDVLAFFAGLGVKVVYGAFERTVEVLSEKLNLGAGRRMEPNRQDVSAALTKRLAEINKEKDPAKHQAVVDLIEEIERKRQRA